MKKGLFAILAVLAVFALVMTGCDTGGGGTKWTVTFDANGGTFGSSDTKTVSVEDGKTVARPNPAPTKAADETKRYIFDDWYTDNTTQTTKYNFSAKVTADITVYAKWGETDKDNVVVTLNGNGGTVNPTFLAITKSTGILSGLNTVTKTREGYNFDKWTENQNGSGTVYTPTSTGIEADITIYAQWVQGAPPVWAIGMEEKVTLSNASQVVYMFKLPQGKKWSDYEDVIASYKVDAEADYEVGNSGRAGRLYGNYNIDFFQFNETTLGNKYAYASLDGGENNNGYILANVLKQDGTGPAFGWITLRAALVNALGECPEAGTWFTLTYKTDGSTKDGTYDSKNKPADDATGPFIFGLGLPGQGDVNTFYVKDVLLKGKTTGTDDLVGQPLFISKDGYDYPAFSAYGTDGGNGEDNLSRAKQGTAVYPAAVAAVDAPSYTITFDKNNASAVFGTNAAFTMVDGKATKQVGKYKRATPFPTVTLAGNKLEGWGLTATATEKIRDEQLFSADTTLYAIWKPLPDADDDWEGSATGTNKVAVSSFGGLGSLNADAGWGPFDFNATKAEMEYDAAIWFAFPSAIDEAIYEKMTVEVTISELSGGKPAKLAVHSGRAANAWSGGATTYEQASADGDLSFDVDVTSVGVIIQHNRNNDESGSFKLTIKSITLIAP